jgi:hypothetical protein
MFHTQENIERMIANYYLKQIIKRHAHIEHDREEPS